MNVMVCNNSYGVFIQVAHCGSAFTQALDNMQCKKNNSADRCEYPSDHYRSVYCIICLIRDIQIVQEF